MSKFSLGAAVLAAVVMFGPLASEAVADPLVAGTTNCAITDIAPGATACFGWYHGNTSQHTTEILALLSGQYTTGAWSYGNKSDAGNPQSGPFKVFAGNSSTTLELVTPYSGRIAIALKGSNEFGIYVFDGGGSTFTVNMPNGQGLSNASLFIQAVVVPEPSTYAMMLAGLAGLGITARRRRKV